MDVTGSVLVSDVSQSPAVLMLEVTGADACGIKDIDTTLVQVVDNTPPSIDVTLRPHRYWAPITRCSPIVATCSDRQLSPGRELCADIRDQQRTGQWSRRRRHD